jgi:lipoprotein-anchoring transpeptidase ErfK/SrfK
MGVCSPELAMFRRRRAQALVAAAGLGGIAATSPADPPPEPASPAPPDPAPATGEAVARVVAGRLLRRKQAPRRPRGFTVVRVRFGHRVSLRVEPRGHVFRRIGPRTEFGSRQTLAVARRRGRWLGVTTTERPNGRLAWVDGRSDALERHRTRVSLRVDRSRRRLELRAGRRTLTSVPVGVGATGSPTPTGRFAVTDKLAGARYRGVYGCCILALSGEQPRPPAGWRGGRRLAIHGTPGRSGTFTGSSAGCVRADSRTMRLLMRRVPLGTPVFVVR